MTTPDLTTAVGRLMFATGDHDSDDPLLPGGIAQYTATLAVFNGDEAAAYRAACGALAAYYAAQPSSLSASGKSLSWADRVRTWRSAAAGAAPRYPFGGGSSPGSGVHTVEVTL
jgi:hypothetical protein